MLKKRKNEDKKYFRERCRIGGTPDENSSSQQSIKNNYDKKRKVKFDIINEKDSDQK